MVDKLYTSEDVSDNVLDIQKDITSELEKQKGLLNTLAGLDSAKEKLALKHLNSATHYNKQLDDARMNLKKLYQQQMTTANNMSEALRDQLKGMIQSQEEQVAIFKKIRDMETQKAQENLTYLEQIAKKQEFIFTQLKGIVGLKLDEITNYKNLSNQISSFFPKLKAGYVAGIAGLATLVMFAKTLYDTFETAAWEFRKYAGMFRVDAKSMRRDAEDIAIQFNHVGVNINIAYASLKALGTEMGSLHNVSKDLILTTSLLSAQLGVSEQNTAGMLRNLAVISKTSMESQKHMALFTQNLTSAAGVPLDVVMGDVAKMSSASFAMMSKMPMAIIKSAVEARRLNTSINDISRASESILDFQNSVNAEMEASVLIGKAINLQRARELAYRGQIVESTKEILNIAKRIDFQNLDYFQMQAFAKATGRSVEELTKMLQAEKQISDARFSSDPAIQKQLKAYEQMKAYNESQAKDAGKNLEMQLMQQANQERMVALQNKWNQLWMQASQVILPVFDFLISVAGVLVSMWPLLSGIVVTFANIEKVVSRIGFWMFNISKGVGVLSNMGTFFAGFATTFVKLTTFFGKIVGFMGVFGKFIPILGWIIFAFQLISSIWNNLDLSAPFFGLDKVLHDVLLKPFKDAWAWISSWWVGRSPSKLALGIVSGLMAVQTMMYNALTYPFRKAWSWMKGLFIGKSPSELALGIIKGLISVQTMTYNALTNPFKKAWAWIDTNRPSAALVSTTPQTAETSLSGKKVEEQKKARESEESPAQKTLSNILSAIQVLNKNLESGKIGVYVDGQLMSATIDRQTKFKGGFGMNVA